MDIFLSKKIISDLKLSDDSIGAYIALKKDSVFIRKK